MAARYRITATLHRPGGVSARPDALAPLPPLGRDVFSDPDISQQIGRGVDEVDHCLLAATLGAGKARKAPVGQAENCGYGLCQGNHGYDHPYGDGSGLGFHDRNLAGNTGGFQLKLDLGA
ncbi:hypothetical protein ACI3KW_19295 [Devosia sp. ZW T5_3]|uniref:hypothetical protein n=1 Tax=Devosia sp. ZW T5_3 TaxID=3378085 RepID=UPI0038539BEC